VVLKRIAPSWIGCGRTYAPATHWLSGVWIASVEAGKPADAGGLRAGDLLLEVDETAIERAMDYDAVAADFIAGLAVVYRVRRDQRVLDLPVSPGVPFDVVQQLVTGQHLSGTIRQCQKQLHGLRLDPRASGRPGDRSPIRADGDRAEAETTCQWPRQPGRTSRAIRGFEVLVGSRPRGDQSRPRVAGSKGLHA